MKAKTTTTRYYFAFMPADNEPLRAAQTIKVTESALEDVRERVQEFKKQQKLWVILSERAMTARTRNTAPGTIFNSDVVHDNLDSFFRRIGWREGAGAWKADMKKPKGRLKTASTPQSDVPETAQATSELKTWHVSHPYEHYRGEVTAVDAEEAREKAAALYGRTYPFDVVEKRMINREAKVGVKGTHTYRWYAHEMFGKPQYTSSREGAAVAESYEQASEWARYLTLTYKTPHEVAYLE